MLKVPFNHCQMVVESEMKISGILHFFCNFQGFVAIYQRKLFCNCQVTTCPTEQVYLTPSLYSCHYVEETPGKVSTQLPNGSQLQGLITPPVWKFSLGFTCNPISPPYLNSLMSFNSLVAFNYFFSSSFIYLSRPYYWGATVDPAMC